MEIYKKTTGIFDGQNVVDEEGIEYEVNTNYASKSKLIDGDKMIVIIYANGDLRFKTHSPVARTTFIGKITAEGTVIDESYREYRVIPSSIAYYRLQEGDIVACETGLNCAWAAIVSKI